MKKLGKCCLIVAGVLSGLVAGLHILIIIAGEPGYRYFPGLGDDLADMLVAGSPIPALLVLALTAFFIVFALYGFSGAGIIRHLPLLRLGLAAISAIYLLRGLINLPFYIFVLLQGEMIERFTSITYDSISFGIGLFYLVGTIIHWKELKEVGKGSRRRRQRPAGRCGGHRRPALPGPLTGFLEKHESPRI